MVQYNQNRVDKIADLEHRLETLGHHVGLRTLELLSYREKPGRREIRLLNMLQFIVSTFWKSYFNKPADALERSTSNPDECTLSSLHNIKLVLI